ncbi:MAG: VWA domain-containing protein, partial [Acidobacteria bacterium]|nr:VWA domain-containing protein [Acidobacteriota bacterium]
MRTPSQRFKHALFLAALTGMVLPAANSYADSRTFPVQAGDTIVVRNDYGSVRILAWNEPHMEVRFEKSGTDPAGIETVAEKTGSRIFAYSFFPGSAPGSVSVEIRAPGFINAVVWGANPDVELSGLRGSVRVHTLTGTITARDLTSSASLITDQGDVLLQARLQPAGDQRLESTYGAIRCEVAEDLNLRGWTRAGGRLVWHPGFELTGTQHEQQIGSGGPLLYVASLHGDVRIDFVPAGGAQDRTSGEAASADMGPGKAPVPAPSPPQPHPVEPAAEPDAPTPATPGVQPAGGIDAAAAGVSIKVNVDWVYLNVSARDRQTNRSVPDLGREDFLVYEDGTLQVVDQFESAEAPFNLLLLLDVSGSTKEYIGLIKDASIQFTRQIKAGDRIAVATFNSRARLVQDFTNDRREVEESIRRIRSGGGTALYDALDSCIEHYLRGIEGRTAIVVFSDGVDNQIQGNRSDGSSIEFDDLFRKVQESDPIVYTIFLDTEDEPVISRRAPDVPDMGQIIIDILSGGRIPTG